ncbi:AAA family ATPase [Pyrococcus kukulkanii]|uniref:AAA family ATPase n=2 Tax=Pyrococcus kukulkanii TaxID=1609559 RepID=UPI00356335F8
MKAHHARLYGSEIFLNLMFYFSCDVLEDYKELMEVIEDYLKLKKRKGVKSAFIFLDEVTFVDEWWRAIKFLIDRGTLRRDTIIGSVSLTLGKHFETFGGRRGYGKTIEVMPLSFREYYSLFYREFFPLKAKEILEEYLETGGYLAYFNSNLKAEDVIGFLKADIRPLERSTDIAKEVMGAILEKIDTSRSPPG